MSKNLLKYQKITNNIMFIFRLGCLIFFYSNHLSYQLGIKRTLSEIWVWLHMIISGFALNPQGINLPAALRAPRLQFYGAWARFVGPLLCVHCIICEIFEVPPGPEALKSLGPETKSWDPRPQLISTLEPNFLFVWWREDIFPIANNESVSHLFRNFYRDRGGNCPGPEAPRFRLRPQGFQSLGPQCPAFFFFRKLYTIYKKGPQKPCSGPTKMQPWGLEGPAQI